MKALANWRLLERYYLIAIDGTGMLTFKKRHCPHCLKATINGREFFYHHILEAKLVMANGFALSVASEFIENSDPNATKQDCELKAFYRLAPRLHSLFPQLPICLLLDSLCAGKPIFDICRQYNWKFIITFKEGSMPALFSEFEALKVLAPENSFHYKDNDVIQDYSWITDIPYEDHNLNVLECTELKLNPRRDRNPITRFVWLTNFNLNKRNCSQIANQGGRLRWKIENEGFNSQKNGGYNLEHAYSFQNQALKNFYILLQVAHNISQFMEKGSLLRHRPKKLFGSIRNIAIRLLESLRYRETTPEYLRNLMAKPFQIRLDSS